MSSFKKFKSVLEAINWDRDSLHVVLTFFKIWSTFVDLLGNISTLFDERLVKKCVKMGKNVTFLDKNSIYASTGSSRPI